MAKKDYEEFIHYNWLNEKQLKDTIENWEFIDSIDFNPYIDDYDDLDELMRAVEEDYDNKPPYENYVFNCVDEYEFSVFLQNKYNVAIMEITTVRYHISRV